MIVSLNFIRETPLARCYMDNDGEEFWIPRSVITHTTKYPPRCSMSLPVHQLTVEDWWWERHEQDEEVKPTWEEDSEDDLYD